MRLTASALYLDVMPWRLTLPHGTAVTVDARNWGYHQVGNGRK